MANNGKKVVRIMKIQFPAGGAKPGPALAGAGIQMPKFCTAFNDQTKDRHGETVPVVLTVYEHLEKQDTSLVDKSLLLKNKYNQLISSYRQYIDKEKINELNISKYIPQEIIDIVKEFLDSSSQKLKRVFPQEVFIVLSLHLTKIINNKQNEQINFDLNR